MYLTKRLGGVKIPPCAIDYFQYLFYFNHTIYEGRWDEKTRVFLLFMVVDHIDVSKEEMKWREEQAG